jgi:hypothetical protein
MAVQNVSGKLSYLRVHELKGGFGSGADVLDCEVVCQIENNPTAAFGFQLRNDPNRPVREGMLSLLRDAFNHGWTVNLDYDLPPGHHNGTILRVWLTKPPVGAGGHVQ